MKIYENRITDFNSLGEIARLVESISHQEVVLVTCETTDFSKVEILAQRFLSEKDRKCINKYKSIEVCLNYIISRSIINEIFSKILHENIDKINVETKDKGKPFISNKVNLKFNISHSNGCLVIGFAKSEIGIDVEKIDSGFQYQEILDHCFSNDEVEKIKFNIETFFRYWTGKEAYLKYMGTGLLRNPREIEVINIENEKIKIKDRTNKIIKEMGQILINENYVGAICL